MDGFSDVLVGLQYGDEGKARIIDMIAGNYNIIARFNGGPNAGHTIELNGKRIALHQIPSGIFHPDMLLYIGSGCVLNIEKLLAEISEVEGLAGGLGGRLHVSDQCSVIQPHHILLDSIEGKELGTTGNGIGPAYADRANRSRNILICDLLANPDKSVERISSYYCAVARAYGIDGNDSNQKAETVVSAAQAIAGFVCDDTLWLEGLAYKGNKILFEGAQAVMLDVGRGTVPFVTSSHTVAGSAYVGGDLPPKYHRKTFGVAKAIMSRVGNGPFVSEFGGARSEEYCAADRGKKHSREFETAHYAQKALLDSADFFDIGIALRMLGDEYGATTKRPRRIGMLDLVQLHQACRMCGVDELYINKFDCLTDLARTRLQGIPVVVGYELDGRRINHVPSTLDEHRKVVPIIEYSPHIPRITADNYNDLPTEAKQLIGRIEHTTECRLAGIGIGPERDQFVAIEDDGGFGL